MISETASVNNNEVIISSLVVRLLPYFRDEHFTAV